MAAPQLAALCWRRHAGRVEILLITSRDTGRWIVPKGWPMADRSAPAAAAQEAWEEAGVRGSIADEALGSFDYAKIHADAPPQPCSVQVFPLRVEEVRRHYPERGQRRRKWFAASKAARKVGEPELQEMIRAFGRSRSGKAAKAGASRKRGSAERPTEAAE